MKRILITGATGFIGRHVMPLLKAQEYEIHTVSREEVFQEKDIHIHRTNLLDTRAAEELLHKVQPSHLLHLAWYTIPGKYWTSELNLDWVKVSIQLFKTFAALGGKRLVVAGSCAEYAWGPQACHEYSTPLNPSTLYGRCKASLYQILNAYAQQINLSYAWGRIFFLYGPFEHKERLVPSVIHKLLDQQTALCSHGNQIRDFMHVEDVARAFVALLDSSIQGPINIASGQNLSLKNILHHLSIQLNAIDKIQFGALLAENDPPFILADVKRLYEELKFTPKYRLEDGLQQTIAWWKQQQINTCLSEKIP